MKNARIRRRVSAVALNALLAVLAVLWLVPVFWLIVSSFRAEQGAYTPYLWPKAFTFDNEIFTKNDSNYCNSRFPVLLLMTNRCKSF